MMDFNHEAFEEALAQDRRLKRVWKLARWGLPSIGRYRRYVLVMAGALGAVWALSLAYLLLAPVSYKSEFTLILPGSGSGGTMNVESIGQAQNASASAFASPQLSPTENYKQLLTADITLERAGSIAHLPQGKFPHPTIKLVDQTNLIQVQISGKTARAAQANAEALRAAFLAQLDKLRADEADKREQADLRHMAELQAKERAAEARLIEFQARHGLATLDQFNARIAAVTSLKDKERDLRLALRQQGGESRRLSGSLATNRQAANQAWRLRGDPVFQQLAAEFAKSHADAELKSATLGPAHGAMAEANAERGKLQAALLRRGHALTGLSDGDIMEAVDLTVADGRSALMQTMDVADAQAAGTAGALRELRGDIAREQARTPELIQQAQQLADLQRDQRVAAAVFSSALARLDTNKMDPFASYPLVQTLAEPSLPSKRSSPSVLIALGGGFAASLLLLIACGVLWLRQPILTRMLRKG